MSISQMLLSEFDHEMAGARRILECVPEDKFDFKPHPKSMTLGRLASHVAEMGSWCKATLASSRLDLEPGMQAFTAKSRAELLATHDANVAEARRAILAASDEDWQKTWTLAFAGKEIFTLPKIAVVRSMVMNHIIHHRAQLGVYLRLNDVEFPGMYGPSADEQKFWEAKK